jgi:hypothetical protein
MRFECSEETIDPFEETIIDYSLVFICVYLVLSLESLLVNLVLFGTYEGAFVNVWVNFNVRVVAQFESILYCQP